MLRNNHWNIASRSIRLYLFIGRCKFFFSSLAKNMKSLLGKSGERTLHHFPHRHSRPKENGMEADLGPMHPAKRPHTVSPGGSSMAAPASRVSTPGLFHSPPTPGSTSGPIRLEDISMQREMRERERMEREGRGETPFNFSK